MSTKIYIASPYTHEDAEVMKRRGEIANNFLGLCMRAFKPEEAVFFSPIAHTRHLGLDDPKYADMWEALERQIVPGYDQLWVLQMDGWKESRGVQHEIQIAQDFDMHQEMVQNVEPTEAELRGMLGRAQLLEHLQGRQAGDLHHVNPHFVADAMWFRAEEEKLCKLGYEYNLYVIPAHEKEGIKYKQTYIMEHSNVWAGEFYPINTEDRDEAVEQLAKTLERWRELYGEPKNE